MDNTPVPRQRAGRREAYFSWATATFEYPLKGALPLFKRYNSGSEFLR